MALESCSVLYFIGYLSKKCINHFNCSNCKLNLILQDSLNDPNSLLLLNKTYDWVSSGGLYTPSPYLQELCSICLNIYQEHWNFIKSQQGILKTFLNFATEKINEKYPNFNYHDCNEHLIYIFNLLFTTKIYKDCKEENNQPAASSCTNSIKPLPKLRILQNK